MRLNLPKKARNVQFPSSMRFKTAMDGGQVMRIFQPLVLAAAIAAFTPASARAQDPEWTRTTHLTFNAPVSLPGVSLPAGSYTFQIANPESGRTVIRVDSRDGKRHYGYFLTLPNHRMEAPSDTEPVVMFGESPHGAPRAVKAWFYPGNRTGYEFVYPISQAAQIAAASHESVLAQ
jgi:hypothetical protein